MSRFRSCGKNSGIFLETVALCLQKFPLTMWMDYCPAQRGTGSGIVTDNFRSRKFWQKASCRRRPPVLAEDGTCWLGYLAINQRNRQLPQAFLVIISAFTRRNLGDTTC